VQKNVFYICVIKYYYYFCINIQRKGIINTQKIKIMTMVSNKILEKAIAQAKSLFTKDVYKFSFTPTNYNHFGISVVNVRGNYKYLIDYTFTKKTGKLVKSKTIEQIYIY